MNATSRIASALVVLLASLTAMAAKKPAPSPDHWVATWATADYALDNTKPGATLGSPVLGSQEVTLRQIVRTTLAGPLVRVEFTNRFGTEPLRIDAAHLALSDLAGVLQLPSAQALTFAGRSSVTIPPGAVAVSDPAALNLPAFATVAISVDLPSQPMTHVTYHGAAHGDNFRVSGNAVGQKALASPAVSKSWFFLKDLQVQVPAEQGTAVAFGDSITDGTGSTDNANNRWEDVLAGRLHGDKKTRSLAVVNEGIGGNRVLDDGSGLSALARFDEDVLALPGVRYLIVLEGINDIGRYADASHNGDNVTADKLIAGLTELVERAHTHGIRVIGATLTPYKGAKYATPEGETIRQAVNQWVRTYKGLDGFVDFDEATRDPHQLDAFRQDLQQGDQLHPSPAGYKRMGDAFDLRLFDPNYTGKYEIHHEE